MKLSLKKCRRALSMLIIASLMLGVIPVHAAQETVAADEIVEAVESIAVDELKEVNIDFDLSDELAYVDEVLSVFQPYDPDGFYVYPNPQEVAAPYIPEGAWCTEVCIISHVVSIDYQLGIYDILPRIAMTVNERGKSAYNESINAYGRWIHGVGNGYGY